MHNTPSKPSFDEPSPSNPAASQVLRSAASLLASAGLSWKDLAGNEDLDNLSTPHLDPHQTHAPGQLPLIPLDRGSKSPPQPLPMSIAARGYQYIAPLSRTFTPMEVSLGQNKLNRQTRIASLIDHPIGVIVEYPETSMNGVAHRFAIVPSSFYDPRRNIQYSLGDSHGATNSTSCNLLLDPETGLPVSCRYAKLSCRGMKYCDYYSNRVTQAQETPEKIVFERTLAFFCALREHGCAFPVGDAEMEYAHLGSTVFVDMTSGLDPTTVIETSNTNRKRSPSKNLCTGGLTLDRDKYSRPTIVCPFWKHDPDSHLILRNLNSYHIGYLSSLLQNDTPTIQQYETFAKSQGYGPLSPCTFAAPVCAQKQLCSSWHRNSMGVLERGNLNKASKPCPVVFSTYTPLSLPSCPYVVIVSRGEHTHTKPVAVKTPPAIVDELRNLLHSLDWRLADATPRKIMLDAGFMQRLRISLGWSGPQDPVISDLHPSLGNLDHLSRYIQHLRHERFPKGTGARYLVQQHQLLPEDLRYVQCAESHQLTQEKTPFYLVICMTKSMAEHLLSAWFITLDTAFKRVKDWQEFEMESWDRTHSRSIVGVRAFTTSQSAEAHYILFTRIFDIATALTGRPVQFFHLHGEGFRTWIADAHKGQALGAGRYCQNLAQGSLLANHTCTREPGRFLASLDPYDHLKRFYRVCHVHFHRNIREIRSVVSPAIQTAMHSLASSENHPDLQGAFDLIQNGGPKAKAWLKDKVDSKFIIPGIYQPASLIPLDIWQASPQDTNGNEQSHRSVNRDGINMTLLGGIHRGMDFDRRQIASLQLEMTHGITSRDQVSTAYHRVTQTIRRSGAAQRHAGSKSPSKKDHTLISYSSPSLATPSHFTGHGSYPNTAPHTHMPGREVTQEFNTYSAGSLSGVRWSG